MHHIWLAPPGTFIVLTHPIRISVDMDGPLKSVNYKVGGTQNPYSFIEIHFFCVCPRTCLLMQIKPEGMTQFEIFHTFVANAVSYCFSELYSKQPKSEIHPKNVRV